MRDPPLTGLSGEGLRTEWVGTRVNRRLSPIGHTVLLWCLLASGCNRPRFDEVVFLLPDLHAEGEVLDSRSLQLPAVVNFWASWCVPCRREHSQMARLAAAGLVPIYGLNYRDNPSDARRWLDYFGNPYAAVGYDHEGDVLEQYAELGVPQTILLDARGRIRFHHIGAVSEQIVKDRLLPLMKQVAQANSGSR